MEPPEKTSLPPPTISLPSNSTFTLKGSVTVAPFKSITQFNIMVDLATTLDKSKSQGVVTTFSGRSGETTSSEVTPSVGFVLEVYSVSGTKSSTLS
ncbi:hypothetical protein ABW636_07885 [Aquimarina sp. 2201CG1-2-11]|uniref:hypothetical protein n=1 Tax=Aquimarina discodermiae TaxID=3231043 RepID=UPI003462D435